MPPLDMVTLSVLMGVVGGPIAAWQSAAQPARSWDEVPSSTKALVIVGLVGTVAAVVALIVVDRWLLGVLLAASSVLCFSIGQFRRRKLS